MSSPRVRPLRPADREAWLALYRGYAAFYGRDDVAGRLDATWERVAAGRDGIEALVVVDGEDRPVGLAHVREFARPLDGTTGLYLDDLFVAEDARGTGAGRALLEHLRDDAARRGLSVVRWITAEDNATARRTYDRVATATSWVTYDLAPGAGPDDDHAVR